MELEASKGLLCWDLQGTGRDARAEGIGSKVSAKVASLTSSSKVSCNVLLSTT